MNEVTPSPPREGRPTAKGADEAAGKGGGRKPRPICNGSDRGWILHEEGSAEKERPAGLSVEDDIPSPRKRADFPRVSRHERTSANRLRETGSYVGSRNAHWCGSRSCARLALPRREGGLAHDPSAPGAYREGRGQSGRVPRGAFVKA